MTTVDKSLKLAEVGYKVGADTISRKNGVITVRRQYFYTFGKSEVTFKNKVLKEFPNANILEIGDHYASFRGGASVRNSSHWWVKFTMTKDFKADQLCIFNQAHHTKKSLEAREI